MLEEVVQELAERSWLGVTCVTIGPFVVCDDSAVDRG